MPVRRDPSIDRVPGRPSSVEASRALPHRMTGAIAHRAASQGHRRPFVTIVRWNSTSWRATGTSSASRTRCGRFAPSPTSAVASGTSMEFFGSGEVHVRELVGRLTELGLPTHGVVLDFGCGVGRLTQAFADHFDEAWGIDIAPSMIEGAEAFNHHGSRVHYVVNDTSDLRRFDDATFDLVFSVIVLQHIRPDISLELRPRVLPHLQARRRRRLPDPVAHDLRAVPRGRLLRRDHRRRPAAAARRSDRRHSRAGAQHR